MNESWMHWMACESSELISGMVHSVTDDKMLGGVRYNMINVKIKINIKILFGKNKAKPRQQNRLALRSGP